MANKTINELTAVTSAVADDEIPIWRQAEGDTRKIEKLDFIGATITGEGIIATGGYTLTVNANATIEGSYEANADVTDAGNVGAAIHGTSAKTTPVDADTMPLIDSAASNVLKKVTWANVKATLKTYFDTLYDLTATAIAALSGKTTPVDADGFVIADSAASNAPKKVTGTNLKAYLKTYFDTLYGALASTNTWSSAQTFSGGINGFVRPNQTTPKTIASGAITATQTYTSVDTEAAAASDDLDNINGGTAGDIIIISAASSTRTVVIKDATGNIRCPADRSLTHSDDVWIAIYNGARWCEISFADNDT